MASSETQDPQASFQENENPEAYLVENDVIEGEKLPLSMAVCLSVISVLCLITGIFVAVVGVWYQSLFYHTDIIFGYPTHNTGVSILVFVGFFVMMTSLLGFWEAFYARRILASTYAYVLASAIILETIAGGLILSSKDDYKITMQERGVRNIKEVYGTPNVKLMDFSVDYMQKTFTCCGILNYTDWINSAWWIMPKQIATSIVVPESCCTEAARSSILEKPCNIGPLARTSLYNESMINTLGCLQFMSSNIDILICQSLPAAFVSAIIHINCYMIVNFLMSKMV